MNTYNLLNINSYHSPFGSLQPNRYFGSENYKYGFGGMEKDDEVKGNGNSYDFGARIYDPRIGRWLTTDPLIKAQLSSYQFGANNPIIFIDPDGNTEFYFNGKWIGSDGNPNNLIGIVKNRDLQSEIKQATKNSKPYKAGELNNGFDNAKLFVINKDVLSISFGILETALEEGRIKEFGTSLKKKGNNYEIIDGIKEGNEIEFGKDLEANVEFSTEGEVSIHSHPTGSKVIDEEIFGSDAFEPSEKDKADFKKREMGIIVGKSKAKAINRDGHLKILKRTENINVYNKDAKLLRSIKKSEAKKILSSSKKSK